MFSEVSLPTTPWLFAPMAVARRALVEFFEILLHA
jgi:hypothetical protein